SSRGGGLAARPAAEGGGLVPRLGGQQLRAAGSGLPRGPHPPPGVAPWPAGTGPEVQAQGLPDGPLCGRPVAPD
ncbi:hypothetical protein HaLaN_10686, partial [Haematococcus lacustris]